MIADAVGRIRLNVVASEFAEAGPAVEKSRPSGNNVGNRSSAVLGWLTERRLECGNGGGFKRRQDRLRRATGGEVHGCV